MLCKIDHNFLFHFIEYLSSWNNLEALGVNFTPLVNLAANSIKESQTNKIESSFSDYYCL